jgi:mannitol-1-phosphate 5-dehydrogenase
VAVFPKDFHEVARQLQNQLRARLKINSKPINIILCTNLTQAGRRFSELLFDGLVGEDRQKLEKSTGIIESLIIRICTNPPQDMSETHPIGIWTNGYNELPVNKNGFIGEIPDIAEIRFVEDMRAEELRKLYTYNMFHAALSYHGHLSGHNLLVECLDDERIQSKAMGALDEVNQMLQIKFGFSGADMDSWIADMIRNTNNSVLGDTVFRLVADPLRKLSRNDRLIGPAMLCVESGIDPTHLINAAAAAFYYQDERDQASIDLQLLINKHGIEKAVEEVCGLPAGDVIHERIVSAYQAMGKTSGLIE